MNESVLHYLWQFQYFNKNDLRSAEREPISILKMGFLNSNAGPDFTDAKIKINAVIEIDKVIGIETQTQ